MAQSSLLFPPFRLDIEDERLWKGNTLLELRRKPFAILRYLAEHPQRLVTQQDLVKTVWGSVVVSESAIRTQLYDIRQVLGDGVVETVVGRGYRFLPAVTILSPASAATTANARDDLPPAPFSPAVGEGGASQPPAVGREHDVQTLVDMQEQSQGGQRQLVFVTGEPGIGKTTVVRLAQSRISQGTALVAHGQCVEQNGHGEPYLPLLEALRRLCESADGGRVMSVLARRAPTWLLQMPGLCSDQELESLRQRTVGATQDRMLRELCEAIEHLSLECPLVLTLEDLQWSDLSTINAVSMLGRRQEQARLMVIGTARQADVLQSSHPLNTIYRELVAHGYARVITPGALTVAHVSEYLEERFPGHLYPEAFAAVVHGITGGTPLFMVSVLDDLVKQALVAKDGGRWTLRASVEQVATRRPENVRQLIDIQIDRLTPAEQRVLEIASAIGAEFSIGLIAAAQESDPDDVEEICDRLVKREHCLRNAGAELWPDGTVQTRYAFRHALFQAVALERSPTSRRRLWHLKIAERLLAGHVGQESEIAVDLAYHLERAQEARRAADFYCLAGEKATAKFAGLDAVVRFEAGLRLLERSPPSGDRDLLELRLLSGLAPHMLEQNLDGAKLARAFVRILALAQTTGRPPPLSAVTGMWITSLMQPDLLKPSQDVEMIVAMAYQRGEPAVIASAISARALALYFRGDLPGTRLALEEAAALYPATAAADSGPVAGPVDPLDRLIAPPPSVLGAVVFWMLGHGDQARSWAERGVREAAATGLPFAQTLSWLEAARLHFWIRDPSGVADAADKALALSTTHGFPMWRHEAQMLAAWARLPRSPGGGNNADRKALEDAFWARLSGGARGRIFLTTVLADTTLSLGEQERTLEVLEEGIAFAAQSGEEVGLAELHRLKAEALGRTRRTAAEASLATALGIARAASARALELRALLSLVRLRQGSKDAAEALALLGDAAAWFTEAPGSPDFLEALAAVAAPPRRPRARTPR